MTLNLPTKGLYDSQGMEDGPDSGSLTATSNSSTPPRATTPNNGGIEMANFPSTETTASPAKINGDVVPQPQPSPVTEFHHHSSLLHNQSQSESDASQEEDTTKEDTTKIDKLNDESVENLEELCPTTQDNLNQINASDEPENKSSSDCDNLVIDEEVRPKRRRKLPARLNDQFDIPANIIKTPRQDENETTAQNIEENTSELPQKLSEQYIHSNPYFAESLFELTNHYNTTPVSEGIPKLSLKKIGNRYAKKVRGKNGKPKLRDYAQYLGLQPTVQFKCSKCGSAGFESLQLLNEHLVNCTAIAPMHPPPPPANNTTNFKVTRKVFLCSACGTYYENWNLFLHMREVHKRFICLYCLGMFPHAEKLAAHLVHKHNCAPTMHADEMAFAGAHREPCFLMCCDCQMVFTEHDYVTKHKCIGDDAKASEAIVASVVGQDVQVTTNQLVIETSATKDGELSVTGTVELGAVEEVDEVSDLGNESKENVEVDESAQEEDEEENQMQVDEDDSPEEDKPEETEENSSWQDETRKVPKVTLKFARSYPEQLEENIEPSNTEEEAQHSEQEHGESLENQTKTEEISIKPSNTEENINEINEIKTDVIENPTQNPEIPIEQPTQPLQDQKIPESKELPVTSDVKEPVSTIPTAGSDVAINEIELDQPLDKFDIKLLLQKCLQATIPTCLYCNHARKIAVNGKQLGLHAIAEHRYSSIVKSITAEELIPESFNNRILECLEELDKMFFTLADADSTGGVTFQHIFECFQCRYSSTAHKELYMHNRKLHSKALLLCTMCKTSFYSYSELLCHLCPGVYSSDRDRDIYFRCCMCVSDQLPSAFRLVVHLRKKHNVCDVCFEMCHNQNRLSNHVWKHKLHHLCYRCGIAYRNKPDITKHMFWKHGTESVECKKCLQKKWPHVYHFCQPPASFACDQCEVTLGTATKLMVHKRLHSNEYPHVCPEENCTEKFISRKLLAKHDKKVHREPEPEDLQQEELELEEVNVEEDKVEKEPIVEEVKVDAEEVKDEKEEKPKPKVDVYDLPELNLSESDSDSEEDESTKSTSIFKPENDLSSSILLNTDDLIMETSQDAILKLPDLDLRGLEDNSRGGQSIDGMDNTVLDIWNNFKNYQENIAKTILTDVSKDDDDFPAILTDIPPILSLEEALRDHDYCPRTTDTLIEQEVIPGLGLEPPGMSTKPSPAKSADHDYCTGGADAGGGEGTSKVENQNDSEVKGGVLPSSKPIETPEDEITSKTSNAKKKQSDDSSSDSDSSSCTCGSNCSCSSGSSSSSSSDSSESDSSSEEGRRRQQVRRAKRKDRKAKQQENLPPSVVKSLQNDRVAKEEVKVTANANKPQPKETPIRDSDLSTTETDTDEDFYDKEPHKIANKLLAEKREKLMQLAAVGPYINGALIDSRPPTPNLEDNSMLPQKEGKKKKSKSKKKKKKKSSKRQTKKNAAMKSSHHHQYPQHQHQHQMSPFNFASKSTPPTPVYNSPLNISNHIPIMSLGNNTPTHAQPILSDNENSTTRASKRRRVPNKFYGYSSDEENEKIAATGAPNIKFRKVDLPSPKPTMIVPPITIKTTPKSTQPLVNPISIKMSANPEEMRVQPLRLPLTKRKRPMKKRRKLPPPGHTNQSHHSLPHSQAYTKPKARRLPQQKPRLSPMAMRQQAIANMENDNDSDTDSSTTSDADEPTGPAARIFPGPSNAFPHAPRSKPNAPPTTALYCYCRCPYDEVSEMIGCDSHDCAIEWFHFECVGIMVPPKGQWYCPDCRKKKQQRREMLLQQQQQHQARLK